jgi:hypothetical protein
MIQCAAAPGMNLGTAFAGTFGAPSFPLASPHAVLPQPACSLREFSRAGRCSLTRVQAKETVEEEAARRGGGRGTKGLYVRPSKALEVGGGFYVPGLEGYRLRVAIVGLIVTLLTLNRVLLPGFEPQPTQVVSETITVLTAGFVLLQALSEAFFGEGSATVRSSPNGPAVGEAAEAGGDGQAASTGSLAVNEVYIAPDASPEQSARLEWLVAAATQTVRAGTSVFIVGTGSRVALAGAGAMRPSADQVDAVLLWAGTRRGTVSLVTRGSGGGGGAGDDAVLSALPATVAQAVVSVSGEGDVAVVVGLGATRTALPDANEKAWLGALADMPFQEEE